MTLHSRRTLLRAGVAATVVATGPALAGTATAASFPTAAYHLTLPSGRTYWLRTRTDSGFAPRPLVVALHGSYGSAGQLQTQTGWTDHAIAHDYALAYGEAVGGRWNVGGVYKSGGSQNDVAYLADLVAHAIAETPIDAARVFVGGFSAGAAMAWRACVDRPDVFAASGMVAGWAPIFPTHPMDCYHIHGDADATVPIRGGTGFEGNTFPAASDEGLRLRRGSRWTLYPLPGGGHGWPGWAADRLWKFWTLDRIRP